VAPEFRSEFTIPGNPAEAELVRKLSGFHQLPSASDLFYPLQSNLPAETCAKTRNPSSCRTGGGEESK